jgi:hypothetical protein
MNEWYSQDVELVAKQNDQRIRQEALQRAQLAMNPASHQAFSWTQRSLGWAGSVLVAAGLSLQRAAR